MENPAEDKPKLETDSQKVPPVIAEFIEWVFVPALVKRYIRQIREGKQPSWSDSPTQSKPERGAHQTSRVTYVRLYHFLCADHALDDIAQRRIKISQIEQLNDPFELWCVYQKDRGLRDALRHYKQEMSDKFGLLCFSKHWHNPILWSHYADRHRGICLAFDIDRQCAKPVVYQPQRPHLALPPSQEDAKQLLYTKFVDWQYEEEWRSWIQLDERDPTTGFYFYTFDPHVRLREVIAGPLCRVPEAKLKDVLTGYEYEIPIIKARLAFRSFRVVKNLQGFSQNRAPS